MVERGANLVVCQHSHCIGCFEEYKDSTIVYGQGNFIFDNSDSDFWKTSLLIRIDINDSVNIEYIPIVKNRNCVRLATGQDIRDIINAFQERSQEILQFAFVERKYQEFAKDMLQSYLRQLAGFNKWTSRIDRYLLNSLLIKYKYNKKHILAIQNYIGCEAHRELLLQGLVLYEKFKWKA